MNERLVIVPPPQVKATVETTAKYVVENGEKFEQLLQTKNASNPKFAFLDPGHVFHAFYKESILKLTKKEEPSSLPKPSPQQEEGKKPQGDEDWMEQLKKKKIKEDEKKNVLEMERVAKNKRLALLQTDPIPFLANVEIPQTITPPEFAILKLAAMFAAESGEEFLAQLGAKFGDEVGFGFLQSGHAHHSYFRKLIEVFKTLLHPTQAMMERLQFFADPKNDVKILDLVYLKKEYVELQMEKEKATEKSEESGVDWSDFVIAETIVFEDDNAAQEPTEEATDEMDICIDNLPGRQLEDGGDVEAVVGKKPVVAPRKKKEEDGAAPADEEEEQEEGGGYRRQKRMRKDLVVEEMVKDPLTGALIRKKDADTHIHASLLNEQFVQQKAREEKKFLTTNVADSGKMAEYLEEYSKRGKNAAAQEEEQQPKVLWDGRTGSLALIQAERKRMEKAKKESDGVNLDGFSEAEKEELRRKARLAAAALSK